MHRPSIVPPDSMSNPKVWDSPYSTLRKKWVEVPTNRQGRSSTIDLVEYEIEVLMEIWESNRRDSTVGEGFAARGWYHTLYKDFLRGRRVLDVGSGLGIDGVTFAQHGANVTFLDLAESNLQVLGRVCNYFNLTNVDFIYMEDLSSLNKLTGNFDVIMAMGSLHHAPQSVIKLEVDILIQNLKPGGRWVQLAYPKTRWIREGEMPFEKWPSKTDGESCPWGEWYDLPKLLDLLYPAKFDVVLSQEFHNNDFIWFDLLYKNKPQ